MPLYEIGLIIDPEATQDEETAILERIEKILTDAGGEVVDRDAWGRRQLAYQINKKNHGIYHFWKFNSGGEVMGDLNFELRTNDMVMRSLILNLDREMKRHHKVQAQLKAKAAKKAAKNAAAVDEAPEAD